MSWAYKRAITIAHSKAGGSDTSNFPMLFVGGSYLATIANGGRLHSASGFDAGFYSDSALTTPLNFELVPGSYDPTTGLGEWWVQIITLSHTVDPTIYIGYGDAGVTTDGSSTATWDSNYLGVYHFGSAGTLTGKDSTANGTDLTNHSAVAGAGVGSVGGAAVLDGATAYLENTGTPAQRATPVTLEAWVNPTSSAATTGVAGLFDGAGTSVGYELEARASNVARLSVPNSVTTNSATNAIPNSQWNQIVGAAATSTSRTLYTNGGNAVTTTTTEGAATMSNFTVGARAVNSVVGQFFAGAVDEVRYSKVARSADYVLATYNSMTSPSTFYSAGSESSLGGGGGSPLFRPYFL